MELKQHLIQFCRQKLLDSCRTLEAAMADLQMQSNEYGPPKDRYDPYRTQLLRRKDMLAQQLEKQLNEIKILDKIDLKKEMNPIQFGSLVTTDYMKILVAVGLGKIEFEGVTYFAISTQVPLYSAIAGKTAGDIVIFNGKKIEIQSVV